MGRKLEEEEEECLSDVETLEVAEKKQKSKNKKKKKNSKESKHGEFVEEEEEDRTVELTNGHKKEDNKLKRKKLREKAEKHKEGELDDDEKVEGSEINGNDSNNKKKEKKKEKKKNKRKKIDSSEEFEVAEVLDNGNGVLEGLESNGRDSKKEKKKKKQERVNQGEENEASIEQEGVVKGVIVSGNNNEGLKYKVVSSFGELNLPDEVLQCCKSFSKPSPIQSHAWPFLLDGRDLIGIAATGSGKTLAYGIPALMHVLRKENKKKPKRVNPLCLVLSPTRELAQQIADVLCEAGETCGVRSVCLYGGAPKGPQISALKSGVDIVIGTPGRMRDLIEMRVCCLEEVSFVVLDEADRMLDLGFEPEVRAIVTRTCNTRQMVMFSATWPPSVDKLAKAFMNKDPVKVIVGSEDLTANHDVLQIVEVIEDRSRDARLVALLEKYHHSQRNRVLVFVLYKKEASRVENMLNNRGWKAVSVHGDKCQSERTKALASFKDGTCPLMVATDVAARGLDIPDVEVVINYSFPLVTEDYVHRIGRTGRAGKKGVAHTFFMQENKGLAGELVNVLREAGQVVPDALVKFGTHVKKKESKLYGAHFKEIKGDAPKSTKITFGSDNED